MALWTINGKTFEEAGLGNLQRTLISQGQDTVTMTADGSAFDAGDVYAFGSTVSIKKDGVQWFQGRVVRIPRAGDPGAESMTYQLAGPWWYLDNLVFQQQWMVTNGVTTTLVPTYKSRIILGQKLTPTGYEKMDIGQQIREALQWSITNGAPFQIGTIIPSMIVPYSEVMDRTCSEIVKTMLRWAPDAVTWFDYSTPVPTLHIKRRAQCTPVSFSVSQGHPAARIEITPRYELRVPCVELKYESQNQIDEKTWTSITIDKAPATATGLEFSAIIMTIELGGVNATNQKQKVKTEPIVEGNATWWKKKYPWLADAQNVSVKAGSSNVEPNKLRELVEGSCPSWKQETTEPVVVKAKISYKLTNAAGAEAEFKDKDFTANVTGTTLSTQEYSRLTSFTPAEPIPQGLAQDFYSTLQVLQFEGSFMLLEEECGGVAVIGKLLNLSNGHPTWTNMLAQIQQVAENIDQGTTQLTFGPAEHLSPQDIIELLRVNRGRIPTWRLEERSKGEASSAGGQTEGGAGTSNSSSSDAFNGLKKLKMIATNGDTILLDVEQGQIQLFASNGDGIYMSKDGWIQIKKGDKQAYLSADDIDPGNYVGFRSVDICVEDEVKQMSVAAGEPE